MSEEKIFTKSRYFEHTHLDEHKIHVVTFLVASRQCVEEFMTFMSQLYDGLTDDDEIRLLVDYRQSGMQPVAYVLRKGVKWANSLSAHPKAHIAFVHNADFVVGMFGALLNSLRFGHLRTQFFDGMDGYDKAQAWLESEQF